VLTKNSAALWRVHIFLWGYEDQRAMSTILLSGKTRATGPQKHVKTICFCKHIGTQSAVCASDSYRPTALLATVNQM